MKKKVSGVKKEQGIMGRPREFDADAALEKAMRLFWTKSYEGTSVAELTETLGISRPSLYAAFGDKQSLFRAALERYAAGPAGYVAAALGKPTAREVAEHLLRGAADLQAGSSNPGGCLTVNGAIACGDEAEPVRQSLNAHRTAGVALLRRRFEQAKSQHDLPKDSDPAALAGFVAAVVYGMAVLASGGASRKELAQVIRTAMKAWPTARKTAQATGSGASESHVDGKPPIRGNALARIQRTQPMHSMRRYQKVGAAPRQAVSNGEAFTEHLTDLDNAGPI